MDIIIKNINKAFLKDNISTFIEILKKEPFEYWNESNFYYELPLKFNLSLSVIQKEKLIGYIIASKKDDSAYIHKFMVDKNYRGNNIGGIIQKAFEDNVLKVGLKSIRLSVLKNNDRAIKFYINHNYTIDGERVDSVNNIEILSMKKLLKQ